MDILRKHSCVMPHKYKFKGHKARNKIMNILWKYVKLILMLQYNE